MSAPRLRVREIELHERDVRLRMPFRFGVVTMTEAPQAFARVRVSLEDGREAWGAAAEMMVPKWFDKDPALSNEDNFAQLRGALALAREAYLAADANTAAGHWAANDAALVAAGAAHGLPALAAGFGPALIERAVLDALCRALGTSFFEAVRRNAVGAGAHGGVDLPGFLAGLRPARSIAARHTVGLIDPLTAADCGAQPGDGLPRCLQEVIAAYGNRWFKLKVGGDLGTDLERLCAIASVLDGAGRPYRATLDGNEQYGGVEPVLELWRRIEAEPRLERLRAAIAFIEQPIRRQAALAADVSALARCRPVIIDESDDTLEAFERARGLGYSGVSSKTCKGTYRALVNGARCAAWNAAGGSSRYFMSGEDLTVQAGIGLQQDLALVSLLGIEHVERNGHHYVNGLAGAPAAEQEAFLAAHPDLYERSHGAVRLALRDGEIALGSLACAGFASGVLPDWNAMQPMEFAKENS